MLTPRREPPVEKVLELAKQGKHDAEIIKILREEGFSPREVNDAFNQVKIKLAVDKGNQYPSNEDFLEFRPGKDVYGLDPKRMKETDLFRQEMDQRGITSDQLAQEHDQLRQNKFKQPVANLPREHALQPQPQQKFIHLQRPVIQVKGGNSPEVLREIASNVFDAKFGKILQAIDEFKEFSKVRFNNLNKRIVKFESSNIIIDSNQSKQIKILEKEIIDLRKQIDKISSNKGNNARKEKTDLKNKDSSKPKKSGKTKKIKNNVIKKTVIEEFSGDPSIEHLVSDRI